MANHLKLYNCNINTVQHSTLDIIKVEYHVNENPLKNSEKIAYIVQKLMYPKIKKNTCHASLKKNGIKILGFYIKNSSF